MTNASRTLLGVLLMTAASLAVTPLAAAAPPVVSACDLPAVGGSGACTSSADTWEKYVGTIGADVGRLIDDLHLL